MCPRDWVLVRRDCAQMDEATLKRIDAVKAQAAEHRKAYELEYQKMFERKDRDSMAIEKQLDDISVTANVPFLDVCHKAGVDVNRFILRRMTETTERIATADSAVAHASGALGATDLSAIDGVSDLDR